VFDNSTNNKKLNATNPDSEGSPIASYNDVVRTGEQSHQEMMYFRINYRWARRDRPEHPQRPASNRCNASHDRSA
jgi:hypothetical protein